MLAVLNVLLVLGAAYCLFLSITNVLWLKLSSRAPVKTTGPKVSVLVPCRNEERNVGRCPDSLMHQSYTNYEVIALDDQSEDGTWAVLQSRARRFPGLLKTMRGAGLPSAGWNGKPFAVQQLSGRADGEYLLLTDADTCHGRDSIAWAVGSIERHAADFLSGYVSQESGSVGERLIVPAMYIMSAMIMPLWLIGKTRCPALSFAIGQYIVLRRNAFQAIGGCRTIADRISDDLCMAREMKRAGFRTVFVDISRMVSCRMYRGYRSAFRGIVKNIYDFFRNRPLFLTGAATALTLFALLPLALLALQTVSGNGIDQRILIGNLGFMAAWSLVLYDRGERWWVPFTYPVLFTTLLIMAWRSFRLTATGRGVIWKGRVIR